MGNGRWSAKSSGKGLLWVRAVGAMFVLLVAGSVLLGLGSRRDARTSLAPVPVSPLPTFSRSSLGRSRRRAPFLGQLPLIFEPNQGRADPRAKFLARGAGYSLFLETTGAVLAMQTTQASPERREQFVGMKLVGANPAAALAGADPLPGKSNYLVGNDPHKWHSGISQFAGVRYAGVYPGIDLIFYGKQGQLEYDFRVAPGADPSQAELQFDGANKLKLSGGDLILTGSDAGGLHLQAPQVYQRDGDRHKQIAGRFVCVLATASVSRSASMTAALNSSLTQCSASRLILAAAVRKHQPSVAVNGDGSIYIAGTTQGSPVSVSANSFPATGDLTLIPSTLSLTTTSPSHIFVAKIFPLNPVRSLRNPS